MAEQPTYVGEPDTGWRPGCGHGRFFVIAGTGDVYCTDCEDIRPGPQNSPIPLALRAELEELIRLAADHWQRNDEARQEIARRLRRLLDETP